MGACQEGAWNSINSRTSRTAEAGPQGFSSRARTVWKAKVREECYSRQQLTGNSGILCREGSLKEDPRSDGNSAESMALSASVSLVQDQAFPLSLLVKRRPELWGSPGVSGLTCSHPALKSSTLNTLTCASAVDPHATRSRATGWGCRTLGSSGAHSLKIPFYPPKLKPNLSDNRQGFLWNKAFKM